MTTKELRKAQGVLAAQIKTQHKAFKELHRAYKYDPKESFSQRIARLEPIYKTMHGWWKNRDEFRHRHIGYSLARGRTMEQIEKPSENHKPDAKLIEVYKAEYEKAREEGRLAHEARQTAAAVCARA